MISPKLSAAHFKTVAHYIEGQGIKLLVSDFNGVLDDYYGTKFEFIETILGDKHRVKHFARLALQTDTAYILDRNTTLENTITNYCLENAIELSAEGKRLLEVGPRNSVITPAAKQFLRALTIPIVIYTAQPPEKLYRSIDRELLDDLHINVLTSIAKPSIDSLVKVLSDMNVVASDACMIGDGLIDDLLPAKLLGMHTILVSPFANLHVTS